MLKVSSKAKARESWHEVQDDEDLQIVAADHGIKDWRLVYEHPKNESLRAKRSDPRTLYRGDRVWIPEIEPPTFERATDAVHHFVLHPPRIPLRLKLTGDEEPKAADLKYELWCDGERHDPTGSGRELRTGPGGSIDHEVPVSRVIEVRIWYDGDGEAPGKIEIYPGHLDPIDTPEGLHDRLVNLGYECGDDPPGRTGEATKEALCEFQEDHGLEASGELDAATVEALREAHGV